jgi:polyisoprenoid-binding protein YceI
MKLYKSLLPLAVIFMAAAFPSQENYNLNKDYKVTIHGSSNLHDWDETVTQVTGHGTVSPNSDGSYNLEAMHIEMNVHSIKSNEKVMNNKTYAALKANAHPEIIFTITTPIKSLKINATENTFPVKGNLTIAGVTKLVDMQVKAMIPAKGKLVFEGSQKIKMTDYGVSPPTALLGVLKTDNDIVLNFKTNFTEGK